jgi:heme exporter protein D
VTWQQPLLVAGEVYCLFASCTAFQLYCLQQARQSDLLVMQKTGQLVWTAWLMTILPWCLLLLLLLLVVVVDGRILYRPQHQMCYS